MNTQRKRPDRLRIASCVAMLVASTTGLETVESRATDDVDVPSLFDGAVAVWHMADVKDSRGRSCSLVPNGDVEVCVPLTGAGGKGVRLTY